MLINLGCTALMYTMHHVYVSYELFECIMLKCGQVLARGFDENVFIRAAFVVAGGTVGKGKVNACVCPNEIVIPACASIMLYVKHACCCKVRHSHIYVQNENLYAM